MFGWCLLSGWLVYLRWDLCFINLGLNFGLGVVAILMIVEDILDEKVE